MRWLISVFFSLFLLCAIPLSFYSSRPTLHEYFHLFRAMKSIAVSELYHRKEAEIALEPLIGDWAHRQFLLTNLVRDESTGGFRWQINVEALHSSLPHIRQSSIMESHLYEGPTLLVRGELSSFIADGDAQSMMRFFPGLREVVVPAAGHNVHIENRGGFLEALEGFLG